MGLNDDIYSQIQLGYWVFACARLCVCRSVWDLLVRKRERYWAREKCKAQRTLYSNKWPFLLERCAGQEMWEREERFQLARTLDR